MIFSLLDKLMYMNIVSRKYDNIGPVAIFNGLSTMHNYFCYTLSDGSHFKCFFSQHWTSHSVAWTGVKADRACIF